MTKIQSQSGNSLADIYDVQGSVAGIEQLETRELPIVHEVGGTVFAERVVGVVRTISSGALLQSVDFDITPIDFPDVPFRILNVAVLANANARVSVAMVGIRTTLLDPATSVNIEGEIPIFNWDSNTGTDDLTRIRLITAAAANTRLLVPAIPAQVASLAVGTALAGTTTRITFRGSTLGFGAGTVTISALIHIAFAEQRGLSSRGLPIPSW